MNLNKIISRKTWGARYRDGVASRPVGSLEKYLHHTVTAHLSENATEAQERAQMRALEQIGQQRFGGGISYTFLIFPSGRIYQGASVGRVSYHSGPGRNTRGAAFSLVGNFEANKLGNKAFNAIVWLLQEGVRRKWWRDPALTTYHQKFKSTACPGKHAISRFAEINKVARGAKVAAPKAPAASKAPAKATGTAGEWPAHKLVVDGSFQALSKRAYQRLLAGTKYYKGKIDANFGSLSVKAEQQWLKRLGYYKGRIDGERGPLTIRALQNFLSAKGHYRGYVDGKFGPVTVRALQSYLNSQRKYFK